MQISPLETKIEHTVIPDEHVEPNLFKTEVSNFCFILECVFLYV
jgi:hypothetical protein